MIPINYFAVVVSAFAAIGIGYLWYGPLFGAQWAYFMGWNEEALAEQMGANAMTKYLVQTIGALVMAYALAHSIIFLGSYVHVSGIVAGLEGATWSWLGFVAPVTLGSVLWDGKPWKLWLINAGYFLVTLLIMGMILGWWV